MGVGPFGAGLAEAGLAGEQRLRVLPVLAPAGVDQHDIALADLGSALGLPGSVDLVGLDGIAGRHDVVAEVAGHVDQDAACDERRHVFHAELARAERVDHVLVADSVVEIVVAVGLPLADMVEVVDVGAGLVRHIDAKVLRRVAVLHDAEILVVPFLAVLQRELGVGEELAVEARHRHFRLKNVREIVGLRLLDHGERRQRALRRNQIQST